MLHSFPLVVGLVAVAQAAPDVFLWGEVVPSRVRLGDVAFIEITAHNHGEASVKMPPNCLLETGTLSIEMTDREQSTTFQFLPPGCPQGADLPTKALEPKEQRVVALLMLPLPRLNQATWRFWDPKDWRSTDFYLSIECGDLRGRSDKIFIEQRPEKEMQALLEFLEVESQERVPPEWDIDRPSLATFGLVSFSTVCSLPDNLKALEEILSPGSLRECVHVTRLTARMYDSPDAAARRVHAEGLLDWVQARPKIQRAYFFIQLANWSRGNRGLGESMFEFCEAVIGGVPEKYVGEDYTRNYRKDLRRRRGPFE